MWSLIGLIVLYNLVLGSMNTKSKENLRKFEEKHGCYY